MFMFYYI